MSADKHTAPVQAPELGPLHFALLEALRENHEHHKDHEDHDGYPGSQLEATNLAAIEAGERLMAGNWGQPLREALKIIHAEAKESRDERKWQKLFFQVAAALNCLPSTFVGENGHVIRAAEHLQAGNDTALLDAMASHRIAVTPEFEGDWDAMRYDDEGEPQSAEAGSTPREALTKLLAIGGAKA